ncbi:MAG: helix-turn-helix transcriptional regulator, partial [Terriglobia bacterium]
ANIVIRLAETTINEAGEKYPGIILSDANDLLQQAIAARDDERFPDAESLAGEANDAALTAGIDYEAAQQAISEADGRIRQAGSEGRDTATASQLLQQANTEFVAGSYVAAKDSAEDAVAAIGSMPPRPEMPLFVIVVAAVAAGGGIGAMVLLRMRKPKLVAPQKRTAEQPRVIQKPKEGINSGAESAAAELDARTKEPELRPDSLPDTISEYDSSPAAPSAIPESQLDKSVLSGIVSKIMEEKPHLRPEDQEVLMYLAEKEGAAFESEIRAKFQLPKTTIWRLVKRLEREELVEIRKAGGQNLIKLKFEDRQP